MRLTLVFTFILLTVSAKAITAKEVLAKMKEKYSSSSTLEYSTTYQLFKGHKSGEVHSSYQGYVYKNGKQLYQKIDKTEMIYGKGFFLKVSHDEKAMLLDLEQKNVNLEIDDAVVINECSDIKLVDKGDYYSVKLVYKMISQSPFSVVMMRIDKKDYRLLQLDLFYAGVQDFSMDRMVKEMAQPHLKIKFENIKLNPKKKDELFAFSKYVRTQNNLLSPTGTCKGYELIDNRLK